MRVHHVNFEKGNMGIHIYSEGGWWLYFQKKCIIVTSNITLRGHKDTSSVLKPSLNPYFVLAGMVPVGLQVLQ